MSELFNLTYLYYIGIFIAGVFVGCVGTIVGLLMIGTTEGEWK